MSQLAAPPFEPDAGPLHAPDHDARVFGGLGANALLYRAGVAVIFVIALVARVQTFTLPWVGVHNAWGGAFYGSVARNFLRYGFGATKMAPVVNGGLVDRSQFEIYYHHPPLTMWLTSVSYQLFGVHEWSARLAPLCFSLLIIALVLRFARQEYGPGTALVAGLFMAVVPVDAYYATQLDPNGSMSIFFTALAVDGYRRWRETERSRYLWTSVAAIALGCMTGWFTYLVVPGIVAHAWLVRSPSERPVDRKRLLLLPAAALIVFALFLLHRKIALTGARPELFDALSDRLLKRTVGYSASRGEIMVQYFKQAWWLYTYAFIALLGAWLLMFARDFSRGRLRLADWCIAILLSYGFLYSLAFPGHLPSHDFFVRTYAPGIALGGAVVLVRLLGLVPKRSARPVLLFASLAFISALALRRTYWSYFSDVRSNGPRLIAYANAVDSLTTLRDPVFLPIPDDRVMQYYMDRNMTFNLATPERLEAAVAGISGHYLVVVPEQNSEKFGEILTYLRQRYPERHAGGLSIFEHGTLDSPKP